MLPDFTNLLPVPIPRHGTAETYTLIRPDQFTFTEDHYQQIAEICNQPLVYETLFINRWEGRPYSVNDARGFVNWGVTSWDANTLYLFFIVSPKNEIAAAIDIKSPDLDSAEIGYWCSADHRGIMTNTVIALTQIMAKAGFKEVYALVKPLNERSKKVVLRANYSHIGLIERDNITFDKFTYAL